MDALQAHNNELNRRRSVSGTCDINAILCCDHHWDQHQRAQALALETEKIALKKREIQLQERHLQGLEDGTISGRSPRRETFVPYTPRPQEERPEKTGKGGMKI